MLIKVKAFPGSKKQEIVKKSEDAFDVHVREKPVQNQANQAIIEALSDYFKVSKSGIKIVKGFKERNKIFLINH